ncbi:sigma-70 family RNA polymerase sigma factor [Sutcliffiella sp. NPDC057660]|uniref:sigma-70 family RNA polymerase sigma factor n=1 Tax=Sutcliffiella sp. NPDC057660 TaxID=3346199 RepID=UPI0036B25E63
MQERTEKNNDEYRLQHLEFVMDQYGEEIKRLIYSYVKDHSIIDDITQDTFLNFYNQLHTFQYKSEIKTWLFRIAINKCKDYLRSTKYKTHLILDYFNNKNEPEQHAIQKQRNNALIYEVMRLPIKYREIIILFYYKDLSISEISSLIDLNENTIKTRLNRARQKLKEKLNEEGDDTGAY